MKVVPLDDSYSYDFGTIENKRADKVPISADKMPINFYERDLSEQERIVVDYLQTHDKITTKESILRVTGTKYSNINHETIYESEIPVRY